MRAPTVTVLGRAEPEGVGRGLGSEGKVWGTDSGGLGSGIGSGLGVREWVLDEDEEVRLRGDGFGTRCRNAGTSGHGAGQGMGYSIRGRMGVVEGIGCGCCRFLLHIRVHGVLSLSCESPVSRMSLDSTGSWGGGARLGILLDGEERNGDLALIFFRLGFWPSRLRGAKLALRSWLWVSKVFATPRINSRPSSPPSLAIRKVHARIWCMALSTSPLLIFLLRGWKGVFTCRGRGVGVSGRWGPGGVLLGGALLFLNLFNLDSISSATTNSSVTSASSSRSEEGLVSNNNLSSFSSEVSSRGVVS